MDGQTYSDGLRARVVAAMAGRTRHPGQLCERAADREATGLRRLYASLTESDSRQARRRYASLSIRSA